ncbi:MAG: tetratricopeptide repeat protein, partial [Bacteroidota bacterium]|nr:tetratricopeptide repeat protein [Bacteroidota bacterium]
MTIKDLFEIGEAYEQRGKLDLARRTYARIVYLHPEEIGAYHKLSLLAMKEGDHRQALAFIDKGLALDRNAVGLWNNRGLAFTELGCVGEAHDSFQAALAVRPNNVPARYNLGRLLMSEGQFVEAEQEFRLVTILAPASFDAYLNLALALRELHRFEEASNVFKVALSLEPKSLEALRENGWAQYFAHQFDDAVATFRKAIALDPSDPVTHYRFAHVLLSTGDLARGFCEYEWRFQTPGWKSRRSFTRKEQWNGEPLHGETLLVHAEQGLGDSLQFVRFVSELAKMDCEVVVDIQPDLYRLCSNSMKFANVRWSRSEALPGSSLQIPLLSIVSALGLTYETLPAFKPYLAPRAASVTEWRGKLNRLTGIGWGREVQRRKQRRVGLVWAGDPNNPDDRNRSMKFETLLPIIETHKQNAIFFSLQKGKHADHPLVIELGDELSDFGDTAAVLQNLDLIIAVDTSIVHLAGAMGKTVWTML